MTTQTAQSVATQLGVDDIRREAERIHKSNPGLLGELHPIWCTGHAVLHVALKQRKEPPDWWAAWRKGGELEKLTHIVNPHAPVTADSIDNLTLCDCGHYTAHPMSSSSGRACPDCYDRMSDSY